MNTMKYLLWIVLLGNTLFSQEVKTDSINQDSDELKFSYKALIVPSVLIGYGVVGLESHSLKDLNLSTKNELGEHIDQQFTVDDVSQYVPFLSVYGLNAMGIKGKHDFGERTAILGTAYLIMGTTVNVLKKTARVERPDGSSNNSFPSGHTATAFMGAEFLYQEYKDVSVWYGVSGYLLAAGTGFFRMYNNRHWLTDVAAGAGIGILSTKIAYWVFPTVNRILFKNKKEKNAMLMPYYQDKNFGIGFSMVF